MSVDYAKVSQINDVIKWIWNRLDQIDKLLSEINYSPFRQAEESKEDLLEERRQLLETYQKYLKELEKCYLEEPK